MYQTMIFKVFKFYKVIYAEHPAFQLNGIYIEC